MPTYTAAYQFYLPDPGGDINNWGSMLNANFEKLDLLFNGDASTPVVMNVSSLLISGVALTATAAELNRLDGILSTTAELNTLHGVTATAAELNILDGVTATTAELNVLDGVTATTAELNIMDGVLAQTSEINLLDGARNHSNGTWVNGVSVEHGLPTPVDVKDAARAATYGYGQTWRTTSLTRVPDTAYLNDTGKPITVAISFFTATLVEFDVSPNNVSWTTISRVGVGAGQHGNFTLVVPAGMYYRVLGAPSGALFVWAELR